MTWDVNINFNQANTAVTANQGQPEQGFYKVRCTAADYFPFKDGKKPYIQLVLSIVESPTKPGEVGNTIRERLNVPHESQSADAAAWTERFLKTAMIGLGHPAEAVNGLDGAKSLNQGVFLNREGFMHYEPYTPGDKSTNSYCTWLDAEQYERGAAGNFKVPLRNKPKAATPDVFAGPALTPPAAFAPAATPAASNGSAGLPVSTPAPAPANNSLAALLT